ncbi:hypothetical protein JCM19237_5534 [Photobacterium aphoticum]|uniref:Uncharacterized protein n=1 Tax=Photobacterium aphoticum TaxID=754436 RepID=A0A090QI85_9GAMM|nr:hypothetical protein JCM19237_5534 [Photobacterium aphoticum]
MIFVDQVEYIDSQFKVIKGFTFSEINNNHAELSLVDLSCHVENNSSVIITGNVDGSGHDDNNKYHFTLTLDIYNGNYIFKEKSIH